MLFFTYGRRVCAAALMLHMASAGRDCFLRDVKYPADIYTNEGANSPEDCQQNCEEHPECQFWTYNPTNNFCFLNMGHGGPKGFESNESTFGLVSGPKEGCNGGPCFLSDVHYPAMISSDRGANSAEECQQICAEHPECQFWTYNPANNFCFLNNGPHNGNGFQSNELTVGLVSGPKKGCHQQTLRAAAAHTDVLVGAALNYFVSIGDADATAIHAKEFDLLTAENGCKWEKVEPNQGRYDFTQCDAIYNFALEHGQEFRGHTIAWGNQNPQWLLNGGFNPTEKAAILVNHVKIMLERYPKAAAWDVVNEALEDTHDGLKNNFWYPDVPNYVELAFETAREVNPNMKLYYNDYSVVSATGNFGRKSADMFNLAKRLKNANLLDGVGLQSHVNIFWDPTSNNGVRTNMQRYHDIGLEVHITELDQACRGFGAVDGSQTGIIPCPAWGQFEKQQQADKYNAFAEICLTEPACTGFELWGYTDRYSWLGTEQHALVFDENLQKKPAYFAVLEAFQRSPGVGCYRSNVSYPPNIASDRGASSPQECQQNCAEHPECQFWTYNPTNNFCFLNNGQNGLNGFEFNGNTLGLVSGPKNGCHVGARRRLVDRLM